MEKKQARVIKYSYTNLISSSSGLILSISICQMLSGKDYMCEADSDAGGEVKRKRPTGTESERAKSTASSWVSVSSVLSTGKRQQTDTEKKGIEGEKGNRDEFEEAGQKRWADERQKEAKTGKCVCVCLHVLQSHTPPLVNLHVRHTAFIRPQYLISTKSNSEQRFHLISLPGYVESWCHLPPQL